MTVPLPAQGSRSWYSWASALTTAVNSGGGGGVSATSANTFTADQEFTERVGARRLRVGGAAGATNSGLLVTDSTSADFFDDTRRLAYVFSRREQVNSGSLFLATLVKEGTATSALFAGEFEAKTSGTLTGSTAGRLTGAQGLVRHHSDTALPHGTGLGAVVQLDSVAGAKITNGHGIYVYKPEKFAGGDIDDYHGVYVSGSADAIGDVLATGLSPRRWHGITIRRGVNSAQSDSRTRSIWAEGRATFRTPGAGGVVIDVTDDAGAFPKMAVADDGSLQWGGGTVAVDSFLARRAAKVLETGGTAFRVGNFTTALLPAPATAGSGALAWDTTTAQLKVSDGTVWKVATLT